MSSWCSDPCPVCFETVGDHWSTHKAWYHYENNHSWSNSTCDCHDICWSCLSKHIETQVLDEGKCSIRCPGIGCCYHLLEKDVEYAMWGSEVNREVLDTWARLRSQSCQDRLKEMVFGACSDESADWLLAECQPCPQCFVLSRRETGCDHIVCRCGCDFCFGCGAPSGEHCLCGRLCPEVAHGGIFFAAWLRSSYKSPCDWLWESSYAEEEEGPSSFMSTLGFWLWIAGAQIPVVWPDAACERKPSGTKLAPLLWKQYSADGDWIPREIEDYGDIEEEMTGQWEQDLAGHLRKEVYSRRSRRSLQRRPKRQQPRPTASQGSIEDPASNGRPKVNRLSG